LRVSSTDANVGHPATALSGPHPELESQPGAPP